MVYDKDQLGIIAEKMELYGHGTRIQLANRVVKGWRIWLADDRLEDTYLRLRGNSDLRKLKKICIELGLSPEGSRKVVFDRVARTIPEISDRFQIGGTP